MIDQGRSFSGRERNCVFLNTGGEQFATVSAAAGLDFLDDGRAVVQTDWDGDGDLDLWISNRNAPRLRLMRNNQNPAKDNSRARYLSLRLAGDGEKVNRDAIGARVEVVAEGLDGKRLIRTLRAGEGFLAQSSKWVHFGLGELDRIDHVQVQWPGGNTETFTGLQINHRYRLVMGAGVAQPVDASAPAPPRKLALAPAEQQPPPETDVARVPLMMRLPLPRQSDYMGFDGAVRRLVFPRTGSSQTTLICLWASYCRPCLAELEEFVQHEQQIREAGVKVIALSVDACDDRRGDPDRARSLMEQLKFPFTSGFASPEFVQLMQGYHNMQVFLAKSLPVPSSFLIDEQGRMKAIYKGPLSVEDLLRDARANPQSETERFEWSAGLPGKSIDLAPVVKVNRKVETKELFNLARAFDGQQRNEDAVEFYRLVLERVPEFGLGRLFLGGVYRRMGAPEEAKTSYQQALAPEGKLAGRRRAQAHFELGEVLMRQRRYSDAAEHFRQALELEPSRDDVVQKLRRAQSLIKTAND